MATASTTALIAVTPALGTQYLQWPVPSGTARPARLTLAAQIAAGLYATVLYLPMNMLTGRNWQTANEVMIYVSLGVVVLMVAALPWGRRVWDRSQPESATLAVAGPFTNVKDVTTAPLTCRPDPRV